MSLLADLLAKIKQPPSTRDVPPNLRNIVRSSARQAGNRKKIILLACIFAAAVASGLMLIYWGKSFVGTESPMSVPAGIKAEKPALPVAEAPQEMNVSSPAVNAPGPAAAPGTPPDTAGTDIREAGGAVPEDAAAAPASDDTNPAVPSAALKEAPVKQNAGRQEASAENRKKPSAVPDASAKRDMYLYAARKFEMSNDYRQALSNYREALKIDTGNVTVMNNIAFMYLKLNLPAEAISYARMALDHNDVYIPAFINMAIANAQLGNYDAAERYLNDASRLDPEDQAVLLNLAVLHERQEHYSRAAELYARLGRLGSGEGLLGEARMYEKLGDTGRAAELYRIIAESGSVEAGVRTAARRRLGALLVQKGSR